MKLGKDTVENIPTGSHTGVLDDIKVNEGEKFTYIDFYVAVDGFETKLRKGVPAKYSFDEDGKPMSKLAIDFANLGLKEMNEIDIDALREQLIGMGVSFTIEKEPSKQGDWEYSKIVDGSLKRKD